LFVFGTYQTKHDIEMLLMKKKKHDALAEAKRQLAVQTGGEDAAEEGEGQGTILSVLVLLEYL
jgi:hypothetical protein